MASGKSYKLIDTEEGTFLVGAMMAAEQIIHSEQDAKPDQTALVKDLFENFVEIEK